MDLGSVIVALVIALGVKVAVMILSARIVLKLYGPAYAPSPKRPWILPPPEHLREIRILWWSLALFALAELVCGIEMYVLFESSLILSSMHSVVSSLGTGLFVLGLYLYLDKAVLRYGDSACVANRICRGCTIRERAGCKYDLVLKLAATFVAIAAVPAFFAPIDRMPTDTARYALPFPSLNAWFDHSVVPWLRENFPAVYRPSGEAFFLPSIMFILEFRVLPGLAALLAVVGIVLLSKRRETPGLRLTALAFGIVCYTYLEIILYPATGDVILGSLGHETVELWFLIAVGEFLRRTFGPRVEAQAAA